MLYYQYGKPQSRAAYPLYRRGAKPRWGLFSNDRSEAENEHPPDERKEGVANGYIF